jgi:hypothetical protein
MMEEVERLIDRLVDVAALVLGIRGAGARNTTQEHHADAKEFSHGFRP